MGGFSLKIGENRNMLKKKKNGKKYELDTLHFFGALAASCVLYNKTERRHGFFIC